MPNLLHRTARKIRNMEGDSTERHVIFRITPIKLQGKLEN